MSETLYYVRVRGRVTGPHSLADLKGMAGVGTLASFHEVSTDRDSWQPAQAMTEIFAPPPLPSTSATAPGAEQPQSVVPQIAGEYEVKLANDPASRPIAGTAISDHRSVPPFGTTPEDASGSPGVPSPLTDDGGSAMDAVLAGMAGDGAAMPGVAVAWSRASSGDRLCRSIATSAAAMLFLCAVIPHDRTSVELVWSWSLLMREQWPVAVLALLALIATAVLPVSAWLISGTNRGGILMAIGGVGLLGMTGLGAAMSVAGLWVGLLLAIPGSCAAVIALLPPRRSHKPETAAHTAAMFAGPAALGLGLAVFCIGIWLLGNLRDSQARVPDWLIGAGVVGLLAGGASIACGAIGLTHATSPRATRAPLAGPVLGVAAVVLSTLAVILAGYGATTAADPLAQWRFVPLQFLRLIVSAGAFDGVLVAGLLEWVEALDRSRPASTDATSPGV